MIKCDVSYGKIKFVVEVESCQELRAEMENVYKTIDSLDQLNASKVRVESVADPIQPVAPIPPNFFKNVDDANVTKLPFYPVSKKIEDIALLRKAQDPEITEFSKLQENLKESLEMKVAIPEIKVDFAEGVVAKPMPAGIILKKTVVEQKPEEVEEDEEEYDEDYEEYEYDADDEETTPVDVIHPTGVIAPQRTPIGPSVHDLPTSQHVIPRPFGIKLVAPAKAELKTDLVEEIPGQIKFETVNKEIEDQVFSESVQNLIKTLNDNLKN